MWLIENYGVMCHLCIDVKYIVQMMSYSSKTLPINLCILYINIVIQCMLYAKKCTMYHTTINCSINGQQYIILIDMPEYVTDKKIIILHVIFAHK